MFASSTLYKTWVDSLKARLEKQERIIDKKITFFKRARVTATEMLVARKNCV